MTTVLWVTGEPPDRNLGGGSIRQAHLIEAAARRAEVHLLISGHLDDEKTRGVLAGITEVEHPPDRQPINRTHRRLRNLWQTFAFRTPVEVAGNGPIRKSLSREMSMADNFDVVSVEHTALAPLLSHQRGNRWHLTMQQLGSRRAAQEVDVATNPRQRWLLQREVDKAVRFERWAVRSFDAVSVPSPEDAAVLGGNCHVVPNGVDIDKFPLTPVPDNERLVLTASLNYLPNVDGAVWFCTEVLSKVREQVPTVSLEIVGRFPTERVRALATLDGVTVIPNVESTVPHLVAARAALVPLRIGSGTRLKALEAMAAGRPVVGTSIGLEGLGLVDGRDAYISDDPVEMAARLVELLTDDDQAQRMGAAGRRVAERFAWDSIGDAFVDVLLGGAR